jgi:hypothetical protein
VTDRRQPRVLLASLTVVLATFLFRLAAFNGFENDHFMHVAWAQQVLFGDWPGRDFVEPGMPLVVMLSALGQVLWPGFLSEALLGIGMVAAAAGFTCAAAARMTGSRVAGLAAGLLVAASYPRLYSYPKLLVPAVALWLVLRYVRGHALGDLWALAAWTVAAFLLRHDLGVMTAAAVVLAIAVDPGQRLPLRAARAAQFVGMGLLVVSPYLVYVQMTEGVAEHVRVGIEFGRAEQHQVLWSLPSLTPEEGGLELALGSWRLSPESLLVWIYSALILALTPLLVAWRRAPVMPAVAALWMFALTFRLVILRHPLRARLPDVSVVAAIAGVLVVWVLVERAVAWRRTRPASSIAAAAVVAALAATTTASLGRVVNLSDRLDQAGLTRGPRGVLAAARGPLRDGVAQSWAPYWPAGDVPAVIDYLVRCARPGDRLLLTWFAPEYYLFAGLPFASGQSQFFRASFATDRDQAVMLDRLHRQTVPFALVNEAEHAEFSRAFPRLAAFLAEAYTIRGRFRREDDSTIGIAVRNDLHPRASFEDPPWVCGYD